MQIGRKNVGILINGPVLDDVFPAFPDLQHLAETRVQEIYLEVKAPAFHLMVKIIKVRIVDYVFKMWLPLELLG
jgi:hypothetical protein